MPCHHHVESDDWCYVSKEKPIIYLLKCRFNPRAIHPSIWVIHRGSSSSSSFHVLQKKSYLDQAQQPARPRRQKAPRPGWQHVCVPTTFMEHHNSMSWSSLLYYFISYIIVGERIVVIRHICSILIPCQAKSCCLLYVEQNKHNSGVGLDTIVPTDCRKDAKRILARLPCFCERQTRHDGILCMPRMQNTVGKFCCNTKAKQGSILLYVPNSNLWGKNKQVGASFSCLRDQ